MSDFSWKGGWHPKGKDGGKESWRGDFKGINQVAGWVGRAKSDETTKAREHVSKPLASLKDPASFGPPPKNVNYHGGAALPNEITPQRGGLGAPLTQSQIASTTSATSESEEEATARVPVPPVPYRADRTGLSTAHLPPPPIHHNTQEAKSRLAPPLPPARSQPKLPPRLPARTNTLSSTDVTTAAEEPPPPTYDNAPTKATSSITTNPSTSAYLNQSAVNRLGNAGLKVPGLGIGSTSSQDPNPWKSEKSQASTSGNGLSELQSRFSRLTSSTSQSSATESSAAQPPPSASSTSMPSWKASQSAFTTANNLRNDPSKVTVADAQSAAQTANQARNSANAFRERHADSIAKGQSKAKAWDQKYKVTSKLNKFLDEHTDPEPESSTQQQNETRAKHQPVQAPYTNGTASVSAQGYGQATLTPLPPPTWSSAVPQHATTTPYQPVQSLPPLQLAETSANSMPAIHRKPPPPPPPSKPQNMKAPPPVPVQTKPGYGP